MSLIEPTWSFGWTSQKEGVKVQTLAALNCDEVSRNF
jgi:hypothetical protein